MTLDVERLLTELTLPEKAALTSGSSFWYTTAVERLGIPRIMVSDGPHGLRAQPDDGDHVGLGASVPATCFPTASAVASSWNPDLLERIGVALATEARATKLSVILGPGVNMKRSPLCGRNFEYFSEDPYLAGELAVGIVDGIQSRGVGTSLKHFVANNQEDDRLRVDARIDERTLREIYLPAFERVVTGAQPWTVMCSYNKVNGTSASENAWLLMQILREEWGFEGLVVSDWGAVYHRVPAAQAGLDLEMPPRLPRSPQAVVAAVHDGTLDGDVLDDRVRAVLTLVSRGLHVLDLEEDFDADAHHSLAREAAGESVVLLENDGGLLPIARGTRVGVVGEFARTPRFQGAGSSQVNPTRVDVALDEISAVLDVVGFEAGYVIGDAVEDGSAESGPAESGPAVEESDPFGPWAPAQSGSAVALRRAAADLARRCDVVVVFLGLPGADESEGFDRTHMDLPAVQLEALKAVAAANPNVVGVLVNGSTVVLGDVAPHTPGLLETWLGGQAAGGAIADVLCGAVNPSGRLAESVPHRLEDNPSFLNFPGDSQIVRYGEGVYIGYRAYDRTAQDVAYPFGFGLSYTTFALSDPDVTLSGTVQGADLAARVEVTVTNQGSLDGAEVVQVYVRDIESSVQRPVRELRGFAKVWLSAGSSQRVGIDLDQRAFSYWSDLLHRWVVEPGEFAIEVARSSREIVEAVAVTVDGPPVAPPLSRDSTLKEWLADPAGMELIRAAAAAGGPDPLADPHLVSVIGTMPMSTLAAFPRTGFGDEELDELVAAYEEATAPPAER